MEIDTNESSRHEEQGIMENSQKSLEAKTLALVVDALERIDVSARKRVLRAASVFYAVEAPSGETRDGGHTYLPPARLSHNETTSIAPFTEDRTPSPKEFLLAKKPNSDVERIVCLAYYLSTYRSMSHFKTLDLSKLNTEAAQVKLSNAAYASDNASKAGMLVSVARGNKQISAAGELYVQALPDRAAAKKAIEHFRPKRKNRKSNSTTESAE